MGQGPQERQAGQTEVGRVRGSRESNTGAGQSTGRGGDAGQTVGQTGVVQERAAHGWFATATAWHGKRGAGQR